MISFYTCGQLRRTTVCSDDHELPGVTRGFLGCVVSFCRDSGRLKRVEVRKRVLLNTVVL
jgi:hypothetical protein